MPTYEYLCDLCQYRTEFVGSFEQAEQAVIVCPKCMDTSGNPVKLRRLITGGSGVIFKGSFPSQDFRRRKEDEDIQRQRRKAAVMKKTGQVPMEAVINPKEADKLFDSKHPEGSLDEMYDREVKEEP